MTRAWVVAALLAVGACAGGSAVRPPEGASTGLQCAADEVLEVNHEFDLAAPGEPSVRQAAARASDGLALEFGGLDADSDGLVWRRDGRVVARATVTEAPAGGWHGVSAEACGELRATR